MTEQVMEKGVEELEKEITCAICHEHYNDPKVLPCCHYYCKQCIHLLTLRTGIDKPFSCPECRQDITLPQGGVDHLQTAFFINRMKELHSKLERAHGKVEAKCEQCSGGKAEAFCRQCTQFICAECVKSHERMKMFAGHKTVSLDELKEGGAKEIVIEESPLQICQEHNEPMKIYCFDCSHLICLYCTLKAHLGHNHELIMKAGPETKKELIQHLDPLKEVNKRMSRAVEEIQNTKMEIEAEGDSVTKKIEKLFEELQEIIDNHKQKLLKETAMKVTQKLEHLSGQEKSLSIERTVIQNVIEYTEQCVEHSTDDEIMCMHGDIQSRIDREMKEHHKEGRSLEPVEEVDVGMEVSCAEDLHQLFQTNAKIIQLPIDPAKCTVTGKGVNTAEVNEVSEFSLITRLTNGRQTKQPCAVHCLLKSQVNGSTVICNVDLIKGHEYRIRYTPTIRGRHELVVSVNGEEVAGSPFPVFVSIHPTQLGKHVRVIDGLKCPTSVATNSERNIVITEYDGNVVMFDEKLRLRSIKPSNHKFKDLVGVAIDKEDNIYFVSSTLIYKCDKKMNNITTTKQKGDQVYLCVAIVGDEVMVCECGNNCTIQVYTKELEHVRKITSCSLGPGEFSAVSSDEQGLLYVVCARSRANPCVQVISKDGKFMNSFGCDESGVNKLSTPYDICVASQYVYVCDYKHTLFVYTTEGEYVTSIGQRGSNEGDFNISFGVCVDRDGFVYVCDLGNNRVQVF